MAQNTMANMMDLSLKYCQICVSPSKAHPALLLAVKV